ncbi:Retrovirus-related Pol polyprotein from transposon 17.6 [Nosema granulosis]|uniref:RNA-directed DNA polymerase n=1 Tax=Nosema granulosis TaxID=83296 RepID=A0A9P6GVZ4_9MICR|nr:Retrovirus-related Pol polyprotein from transposon 17.6 [Nosema granulosis]
MFSSKYFLYVQRQQRKAAGAPFPSTKAKAFEDSTNGSRNDQGSKRTSANVRSLEPKNSNAERTLIFTKNMQEKEVLRELFIMECESDFETQSLKTKMMKVIKLSIPELKDWFYDKGVDGNLPSEWEEFKCQIVNLCTEQALESIYRYRDEPWSSYIVRLKDKGFSTNIPEEEIFRKLRKENAPEILRQIFYSFGITLNQVVERVKEYENNAKDYKERLVKFDNKQADKWMQEKERNNPVTCYKCYNKGHYASECTNKEADGSINHLNKDLSSYSDLDTDFVTINNISIKAVFDSGASESVITSKLLRKIGIKKTVNTHKEFGVIDGSVIVVDQVVDLEVEFKERKTIESFNVVINEKEEILLLSNACIKGLRKKEMPIECTINTKDHPPISWSRPIKNLKDKKDFEKLIEELESRDIVEGSNSAWLNPAVLVRKKNGNLRFCGDFRKLNDIVELDGFEIPKIQELITLLHGKRYFTCIDLKDGFFQVPIRECDKEKTAFYTGRRLMQFKRMPQGFKNSSAIFQRAMQLILEDLLETACLVYIDDILVFGKNIEEHDRNLRKVLSRLKEYNLEENTDKRIERVESIKFLGYEISYNLVKPTLERAQGIMDYKSPETRKELQRFIGMINYDRHFVRGLSDLLAPLYKLQSKETKFVWTEKEEKIFNQAKQKWKENLELYIPNMEGDFTLETDASDFGLGACLRQNDKPVAYLSRNLSGAEKNYGITEREVLASLWAMEKLQYYLVGKKFTLITDHKAIEFIKTKIEFGSSRVQRWFHRFEKFNFDIKYRKGVDIVTADALSRSLEDKVFLMKPNVIIDQEIKKEIILHHMRLNHRKKIKNDLLKVGINVTQKKVDDVLKDCWTCLKKDKKPVKPGKFIYTFSPGEKVSFDILEIKHKDYVILAIDYFSRKIFGKTLKTKDSTKILEFIMEVHRELPIRKLISDNGREFNNAEINRYCKENKIERIFSIPYYHQSNGRIERANRTIREALKHTKGPTKRVLKNVIAAYNLTHHRGIGMPPNDALRPEMRKEVLKKQDIYAEEFKRRIGKYENLKMNEHVLIKNETKENKMDNEFDKVGVVTSIIGSDSYEVQSGKIKLFRHASQLKRLGGGMLDVTHPSTNHLQVTNQSKCY